MSYRVTVSEDNSIQELFHTEISPAEIIPPDSIEISDFDGETLRECSCFSIYQLVDGSIELMESP